MLLLGRRSRATQPLRMINRGTKALNTPFHLFSFGLIGAANIILFSVASVSFLTAEKKPLIVSSSGEAILRQIDDNAAPILAPTYLPTLDAATTHVRSQEAPISETAAVSEARPADLLSPENDASETTSEPSDASLIQTSPITRTETLEVSGSEQALTEPRPMADEVSAKPDVSPVTVPTEISEEKPDHADRNFQPDQNQPAQLKDENARSHRSQNPPVHQHFLRADAALRARVQKECGPIVFPALRRHCVATFGIYHR